MKKTRVLIVSKPLSPPWNDGSKNMARDLVLNAPETEFHVLCAKGKPFLNSNTEAEEIFDSAGQYQPSFMQNVKTFLRLLKPDPEIDIYHFFFAPNARTSSVLKFLMKLKKQKTLQTVASAPEDFSKAKSWFFADKTVAVSEDTRRRLQAAGLPHPACVPPGIEVPSDEDLKKIDISKWKHLRLGADTLFLYPGDYEHSGGHEILAALLPELLSYHPALKIVFACRTKTPKALEIQSALQEDLKRQGVHQTVFVNEAPEVQCLLMACDAVLFPVKSLHKKVDIPLTLLEAMALGKPVIASRLEPLRELVAPDCGFLVDENSRHDVIEAVLKLVGNPMLRREMGLAARKRVREVFNARKMAEAYEKIYGEMLS